MQGHILNSTGNAVTVPDSSESLSFFMRLSHPSAQPTVENFFFQREFHEKLPHLASQAVSSRPHQTLSLTAAPGQEEQQLLPPIVARDMQRKIKSYVMYEDKGGTRGGGTSQGPPTHPFILLQTNPKAKLLPLL